MNGFLRFRSCLILSVLMAMLAACQLPMQIQAPVPAKVLQLHLEYAPRSDFRLLAGHQLSEVDHLRFCLIEHSTGTSPAGGVNLVPLGNVLDYTLTHLPSISLNISHVRANLTEKSYSLAVAAFDDQNLNITNATGDNAELNRVTIFGESGNFYLSDSGGNTTYPGSFQVEPLTYALTGSVTLGVALKLADG